MKKALIVVGASYLILLAFFAIATWFLPLLRQRVLGGFTIGDVVTIIVVLLYGLFIYLAGFYLVRGSCKSGY